jgi:hypothetical protein
VARFLAYALGVIGLVETASWIAVWSGGGGYVAGMAIYVAIFALPLLSAVAALWLVVDTVRRFIRCRFTRTA